MSVEPPTHHERVAQVYEASGTVHPTKDVAEHFGVSRTQAADWVRQCRRKGLLPPATKGRATNEAHATARLTLAKAVGVHPADLDEVLDAHGIMVVWKKGRQ